MKKKGDSKKDYQRGRVEEVTLQKSITFNRKVIKKAVIEIDHINYGLNSKTFKLNDKKRTQFSIADVLKFIEMLDDEEMLPFSYSGRRSRFVLKIDCPIRGRFYNNQFIMVFETDYDNENEIYTVTLYPKGRSR